MRRTIGIAALVAAAGLPMQAQSSGHPAVVCTKGNSHAICAPLIHPKPRIEPIQKQLDPPEGPYSVSIDLAELGIAPDPSPELRVSEHVPGRAVTTIETVVPASRLAGTFSDVLSAVQRHELMQAHSSAVLEPAERPRSERALSAEARGFMDSLRTDLQEMNDFAPGVSPDITVDRSARPGSDSQLKGQLILFWQDMRDEYCTYNPGAKYVGLDSSEAHCQDPRASQEKRAADQALNLMKYLVRDLSRISLQEQDHAKDLHCAGPCPPNAPLHLTSLSSSDPSTERIIQADRRKWLEMRQVYCHYYHGADYIDLESKRQTCQ